MNRLKDYDESIFEESCKKGDPSKRITNIEECGNNCKPGQDVAFKSEASTKKSSKKMKDNVDFEEECGDKSCKGKNVDFTNEASSKKRSKKSTDIDFEDECGDQKQASVTFGTESAKPKKRSKKKLDTDIDFEEECGDGCRGGSCIGFKKEAADATSTSTDTTGDTNFDSGDTDIDTGDVDTTDFSSESAKPKKKKKIKEGTDTNFTDDDIDLDDKPSDSEKEKDDNDDECDDDSCDEPKTKKKKAKQDTDLEDEEDKPKKKSGGKKKKKSTGDLDLDNLDDEDFDDSDDDEEEEEDDDPEVDDEDDDIDFDEEAFFGFGKKKNEPKEDKWLTDEKKRREEASKHLNDSKNMSGADKAASIRKARMAMGDPSVKVKFGTESSDYDREDGVEHSDKITEYMIENYIDKIEEDQLRMERAIMTSLIEDLYKEYAMSDFINFEDDEEIVEEADEEYINEEDEIVQERFFGGTGKTVKNTAKPVAKVAKKLNDHKHGVGRKGIIRNVVHRTKKDLKKGGILYKLLTWPFLIIKNLVQTIYHKTKSFVMYKGLLTGIEVKVNREIAKIRKSARNLPKVALASGIGFATTALTSVAKGEQLPIKPADFIASEGAKLVEELGRDSMIRAITSKLADAIEDSPEKVREVIRQNKEKAAQVSHEAGQHAKPILTMNQDKVTMQGVVNVQGVNGMLDDIDEWVNITETVVTNVRAGDEASVTQSLSKMKSLEEKYIPNGKLNSGIIFNSKSGAVKIADFYDELASKLAEKTKQIERGLEKITGLEVALKDGNVSVAEDTKKSLAELNTSIQHTCNAFLEMIDSIDDLGKYVTTSMNSYLGCLQQTNACLENMGKQKGGTVSKTSEPTSEEDLSKKKHRHKLFGKKELEEE